MRLLHSSTLEFHEFHEGSTPPYIILSHTWGDGEISYQDMCQIQRFDAYHGNQSGTNAPIHSMEILELLLAYSEDAMQKLKNSRGYAKIQHTARLAKELDCEYFWVDTCAIDKKSSSELQESINSMFRWYQKATKCVVHLEDVNCGTFSEIGEQLKTCRWVKRGWTLQELIAPREVLFYDRQWDFVGSKRHLLFPLQIATKIPRPFLTTRDLSQASIAQKMSWAADRITTRIEDRAYSLLGLFGVHMALLYGEGENAFLRLQEEILRTTPDDSIFAWQSEEIDYSFCGGLLATSPSQFRACGRIRQGTTRFTSSSSIGIRLDLDISPFHVAGEHEKLYAGWLQSGSDRAGPSSIILRLLGEESEYGIPCTRVRARTTRPPLHQKCDSKSVIVRQNPTIPRSLSSAYNHCFHLRRGEQSWLQSRPLRAMHYRITRVWPPQQYVTATRQLLIPNSTTSFVGVLFLEGFSNKDQKRVYDHIQLLLGQDKPVPRYWCKFTRQAWLNNNAPDSLVKAHIERLGPFDDCGPSARIAKDQNIGSLTANIHTDLYLNRLALVVTIDGLRSVGFLA